MCTGTPASTRMADPRRGRAVRSDRPTMDTTAHGYRTVVAHMRPSVVVNLWNVSPYTVSGMWSSVRDTAYCDVAIRSTEICKRANG
jgi:hypothetical protein